MNFKGLNNWILLIIINLGVGTSVHVMCDVEGTIFLDVITVVGVLSACIYFNNTGRRGEVLHYD